MNSNEDNKIWISNILVRNDFFMFKTILLLLNFCLYVYTETKKFSNTLQIRIFITEIHVEITQTE